MVGHSIGNVMSRLAGLKNVSGRRVMPGAEFLEGLDDQVNPEDVSGVSNESLNQNLPTPDLGGELTPQSYDVRANSSNSTEEEGLLSNLRRFGEAIGNKVSNFVSPKERPDAAQIFQQAYEKLPESSAQTPPIETAQVDMQEGLPPVTASEEENETPIMSKLSNGLKSAYEIFNPKTLLTSIPKAGQALNEYAQPFKTEGHYYGEPTPENEKLIEDAQLRAQGINPDEQRSQQAQSFADTQKSVLSKMDKALENPTSTAIYGASDVVANQPELNESFKTYTGIDFNDEIANQTKEYERVLDDMQNQINQEGNGYTEQEQRIKERILNNQATDADKFYIGLAVMMPLLVGAFFGKEAALGALGGGAKGFADILGRRQKDTMENEKLLADIGVNKGNLGLKQSELDLKRLALPGEIKKNLPKDEREHLLNKREVTWIDPNDGLEKKGWEIKPGLVAPEQFVTDKQELKEMRKEASEISQAVNATKEINKLTGEIIDISSKLGDKNIVGDAIRSYVIGKDPGLGSKLGEQVEYNGRMVNSYVVLEHKLKLLVDAYRQAKGMRALTNTVQEHIEGLFRNPAASFQNYEDTIDQMLYTRDLAQERLLNAASGAGFVPEFVAKEIQPNVKSVYDNLNKNEGEKKSTALLRE